MNEANTITNLNVTFGYSYLDIPTNEQWIEFHIDYWNRIMQEQQPTAPPVINEVKETTTSIRVSQSARPIMILGQDESVFAQYLLGSKTWVGP
jgi:hypothetical protein